MLKNGDVVDGKYEILNMIGKGGMSVVYLARDKRLNKLWAIKEISMVGNSVKDRIHIQSLLTEAELMKKLDHPALPRIVDIIETNQTKFVIMDYIEGKSLDKILLEYGAQPENVVIEWGKQLCDVLHYLHTRENPIVYRDMKPANVILKPEGNLKLIDFGIAYEMKKHASSQTDERPDKVGTKGYASPEQYTDKPIDTRSDIYSLGMTLHYLLTGVDPSSSGYKYFPVRQWNPELSDGIEAIINQCTAHDAKNRYQNCQELMYDLEHPELKTKEYRRKQKNKLRLFTASLALCVLALGSGFGCKVAAYNINQNNYESLISVLESTDYQTKIDSYKQAIEIYPSDMRAYLKILEAYESEGKFSKAQNDEFLALYNPHQADFDQSDAQYLELNYKIGMLYFNYYTNDDGVVQFSDRVQKAYPFFQLNHEIIQEGKVTFESEQMSECYYHICTFYSDYILNSVNVEEASYDDYMTLLNVIEPTMESNKQASAYDQLTFNHSVMTLLYDQRSNMASLNIDENQVIGLMNEVLTNTEKASVQKEQSQAIRTEILNKCPEYIEAIQRAYFNARERV